MFFLKKNRNKGSYGLFERKKSLLQGVLILFNQIN